MESFAYMDQNYAEIKGRIDEALKRSGREDVTLVAAIKYTDAAHVNYLHRVLGVHDVGENRVQQLLERWDALDRDGLNIHFIGTLQRNKVKYIIDKVDMIQSLDSEKLAREIERQAAKIDRVMDVLVEINSGSEISKGGVEPADTEDFTRRVVSGEYPHLRLRGFMTMAPKSTDEEYREIFGRTRVLCEGIWERLGYTEPMVMSMGMSESYIPAAASGSTMVRVGRGLFVKESASQESHT